MRPFGFLFLRRGCRFIRGKGCIPPVFDQSDATALLKYASLMSKYAEFAQTVDGYNEGNLSAEDYKYYVDVMARVNKKLIDTSVTVGE